MQQTDKRPDLRTRTLALVLALALVLGLLPGFPGANETAQAHWADSYLDSMVEWGFIRADQAETPDEVMTRADFMAIINRAYGYTQTGPTPFEDVDVKDWFYDDVGIAYNANYIYGTSPTTVSPNDPLTRETSATILGRNMMLKESEGEILDFSDARDISSWARGTIKSSLEHYLVNGYDDGTFRPQKDLTWGEMAAMVTRIVGMPIQEAGDYALGGVFGNVTVSSDGVTLRDSIISGDLYITGGVGLGGVKLENVTVLGRIIASGSGESEAGSASIVLRNVVADELLVDNLQGHFVTVQADGVTEIGQTTIRTDAYVEDNTPEGLGLKNITLDGDMGTRLDLAGRIETVRVATPNAQVNVAKGTVASMTVDENAPGTNVTIARGAVINELNLDIGTYVSGDGDIKKLNVNAEGCIVTMMPEEVYIRPGITAVINNQIMDSTAAEEASREPMILAGYPLANDVAPTSFQAVFATNKKGTVYWAVSSITDGSVATEDLLHPPTYGGISVANGSVAIPAAEELVGATVGSTTTGNNSTSVLTPGGSYYLAAVLVDDRGVQSPTKVIALTLPDDSVPAFAEGYPYMSLISTDHAQATVMPTKSCKLYYALLPKSALQPGENEFKTSSISGALGYGVVDVEKNTESVFDVNDLILDEETEYVAYFWLVDTNGANKSAIISLPFTTPDETPPEFIVEPTPANIQATSVGLTFRVNEDATVYWVAVPAGTVYPKPQPGSGDETAPLRSDYAILQVVSGMNIGTDGKAGSVTVKGNADGVINITGLQEASAYDLYYVAQDTAGNYSVTVYKKTINSLDLKGPQISQFFSKSSSEDGTQDPTSETDITLEFSENVRYSGTGGGTGFLELWEAVENAQRVSGSDYRNAVRNLVTSLYGSIRLYKVNASDDSWSEVSSLTTVGDSFPDNGDDFLPSMTIDYTHAEIESKNGAVRVTFPNSALHLENGAEYFFVISNLTDTSNNYNELEPNGEVNFWTNRELCMSYGHNVPPFTVEPATVRFTQPGVSSEDGPMRRTAIDPDDENDRGISDDYARVDFDFLLQPISTNTVSSTINYDVLIFTMTACSYNLYYRVLDEDGKYTGENGVYTMSDVDPLKNTFKNSKGNTLLDDNGWIFLGNSGDINPGQSASEANAKEWSGMSVSKFFNGCDSQTFPKLEDMKEDLRLQFVIEMTSINGSSDDMRWNETVYFEANVAAEQGNTLNNMVGSSGEMTRSEWQTWKENNSSTVSRSIGRWTKRADGITTLQDTLEMNFTFKMQSIPVFSSGAPSFPNIGSTSVEMNLKLQTDGWVYWVIGKVDDVSKQSEVPTYRKPLDGEDVSTMDPADTVNGEYVVITTKDPTKAPPLSGAYEEPEWMKADSPEASNMIVGPSNNQIYLTADGRSTLNVTDAGVFYSEGLGTDTVQSTKLEPSTTYFLYCVIKGTGNALSHVYLYQFTTEKPEKPRIQIAGSTVDGTANIGTKDPANVRFRLYTVTNAKLLDLLKQKFTDVIDKSGEYIPTDETLPDCYKDEDFTVLDALSENYSFYKATGGTNKPADGIYYPKAQSASDPYNYYEDYTVFDIYAGDTVRTELFNLIQSYQGTPDDVASNYSDAGTFTTKGNNYEPEIKNLQMNLDTEYLILVCAENTTRITGESAYEQFRSSYRAYSPLAKTNDSPPDLLEAYASGDFSLSGNSISGTITLQFDSRLYQGDKTGVTAEYFKSHLIPASNVEKVVFAGGGETSNEPAFMVEFKNLNVLTGALTVNPNTFYNLSGAPATETLKVKFEREREDIVVPGAGPDDPSTTKTIYHYYCIVTWDNVEKGRMYLGTNEDLAPTTTTTVSTTPSVSTTPAISNFYIKEGASITLDGPDATATLNAVVTGANVDGLNVSWSSSDPKLLSVSGSNRTAVLVGKNTTSAPVTVKVTASVGGRTASIDVTIPAVTDIVLKCNGAALTAQNGVYTLEGTIELGKSTSRTFEVTIQPSTIRAGIQWELKEATNGLTIDSSALTGSTLKISATQACTGRIVLTVGGRTWTINIQFTQDSAMDGLLNAN